MFLNRLANLIYSYSIAVGLLQTWKIMKKFIYQYPVENLSNTAYVIPDTKPTLAQVFAMDRIRRTWAII